MDHSFDVAIAGGGPAGMAMAIELAPSVKVAVVDAGTRGTIRGETLPPGCRPILARLGVHDAFAGDGHARCEGTMAAWGAPALHVTDYLLHPERHGWRLDREAFDRRLGTEATRRGAVVIRGSAGAVTRHAGGWRMEAGPHAITARVVVDATGRKATLARRHGARRVVFDRLVGIAGVLEPDGTKSAAAYPLIEARRDGWVYSTVAPAGEMVVVAMTDSDIAHAGELRDAAAWRRWIDDSPRARERIGGARLRGAVAVSSACSQRLDVAAGDGWLAAGDAAAAFDPLSSQGIVSALASGIDAAGAVRAWLDGDAHSLQRYAAAIPPPYDNYLHTRRLYYTMERRWSDSPFWKRRNRHV